MRHKGRDCTKSCFRCRLLILRDSGGGVGSRTIQRKVVQGQAVYAGTKAAVLAISDGLRQELAGKVRVTVILPGYTNTDFPSHIRDPKLRAQMEHSREQFAMSPDAVARAMAYAIDEPDDVNIGEIEAGFFRRCAAVFKISRESSLGERSAVECRPHREFREARIWVVSVWPTIRPDSVVPTPASPFRTTPTALPSAISRELR